MIGLIAMRGTLFFLASVSVRFIKNGHLCIGDTSINHYEYIVVRTSVKDTFYYVLSGADIAVEIRNERYIVLSRLSFSEIYQKWKSLYCMPSITRKRNLGFAKKKEIREATRRTTSYALAVKKYREGKEENDRVWVRVTSSLFIDEPFQLPLLGRVLGAPACY
jgi:hypothetical protein